MSIFYLLTHDIEDPDRNIRVMSQSMLPYLLGTLAFLIYVCSRNSAVPTGSSPRRRASEQFEFSEATYEEKVIYLMTQMRWWDYYCGLWLMNLVVNVTIAWQTRYWPCRISMTYVIAYIAYNYFMSMAFALAEIQLPSLWDMLTDGHRMK
ncbi:hypothetical protein FLONG3_8456 [Fusarium longipes]|uniref:Uncharacterized protein n=1 Tax=Fusarium longipes TaxID=694270 RepID=A0A395S591_9HYPO|nr:hypothetical protein FLONG3_8456 [Fusarium longipes]